MDSRSPARVLVVAPDDAARDSLTLALGDVSDVIGVAGDGVR